LGCIHMKTVPKPRRRDDLSKAVKEMTIGDQSS